MTKHQKTLASAAALSLIIGIGIGYALPHGTATAPSRGSFAQNGAGRGGFGARAGMQNGTTILTGTVADKSANGLTLNTRDGSSHVILVTPSTTVSKSVTGTLADVTVGSTVFVSGTTDSGGSLSAETISLRPSF